MRETKYRAWSKKYKRMYEVIHLHFNDIEGVWATVSGYDIIEQRSIPIQVQPKDLEIVQYTGLHDQDEQDIWEGDILQCDFSFYDSNGKRYQETSIGVIMFYHGGFYLKAGHETISGRDIAIGSKTQWLKDNARSEWKDFKKIGNMFENPDLIQR